MMRNTSLLSLLLVAIAGIAPAIEPREVLERHQAWVADLPASTYTADVQDHQQRPLAVERHHALLVTTRDGVSHIDGVHRSPEFRNGALTTRMLYSPDHATVIMGDIDSVQVWQGGDLRWSQFRPGFHPMAPHDYAASLSTLRSGTPLVKWEGMDLRILDTPCGNAAAAGLPEGLDTVTVAGVRDEKPMFSATFALLGTYAIPLTVCDFAPDASVTRRMAFSYTQHPASAFPVPAEIASESFEARGGAVERTVTTTLAWSADTVNDDLLSADLPRMLADLNTAQYAIGLPVIVHGPGQQSEVKYFLGGELLDADARRARVRASADPDHPTAQP